MAEKRLTDTQCKSKPKAKLYYKNDGAGLRLQIRPDGAKYWMLRYTLDSKDSTAGLGRYPEISLEEARKRAAAARNLIAEGIPKATSPTSTARWARSSASRSNPITAGAASKPCVSAGSRTCKPPPRGAC